MIISANAINDVDELPIVLAVHLVYTDPENLLAIQVGDHGWARVLSIEPVLRRRLVERVGLADAETMDAVNAALRAAQDL